MWLSVTLVTATSSVTNSSIQITRGRYESTYVFCSLDMNFGNLIMLPETMNAFILWGMLCRKVKCYVIYIVYILQVL